ncbi:MAG: DUF6482 family protein [Pseudomonadota bacterium]
MYNETDIKKIKEIEKVIIHSHENSLYLVSVIVNGLEHFIQTPSGDLLKRRNKIDVLRLFEPAKVRDVVLRHQSAYDEMIGHDYPKMDNRLEVKMDISSIFV